MTNSLSFAPVFLIAVAAVWPLLLNTASGVVAVGPRCSQLARSLCATGAEAVFKIIIPSTLGHVLTGLRLAVGIVGFVLDATLRFLHRRGSSVGRSAASSTCTRFLMSQSIQTPVLGIEPVDREDLVALSEKGKANPSAVRTLKVRTVLEKRFCHLNYVRDLPAHTIDDPCEKLDAL